MAQNPPKITACLLARNEEARIGEVLKSLQAWTDQIIVIDDGDATAEIAARYAETVLFAPKGDSFDSLRSLASDRTAGDWIFFPDADEPVPAVLKLSGTEEIDILKRDGEGLERASLESTSHGTFQKVRLIGECHEVVRPHRILKHRQYATHTVNLIGDAELGRFFCEHTGKPSTTLEPGRTNTLRDLPWLCSVPIDCPLSFRVRIAV